jgi:hypothetical protein
LAHLDFCPVYFLQTPIGFRDLCNKGEQFVKSWTLTYGFKSVDNALCFVCGVGVRILIDVILIALPTAERDSHARAPF